VGLEAKTFTGPVVEFVHDVLDPLVCERLEFRAFGKVLANEDVGVLVESAFPRVIGVVEVAMGVESLGDGLTVGELLAVIIVEFS
jgi:hypothetical protein